MEDCSENKQIIRETIRQIIDFKIKHRKIMQHYLQKTGVYHSQHRLLMEIARNKYASQKDLAKLMGVSTATIAVSLKKLQKNGYINKLIDKNDNRLNNITITKKGNEIVKQSKQIVDSIDEKLFSGFKKEDIYTLFTLFQKLNANLDMIEDEIDDK
ncbi:MarR family winged helix-turn-helix transcriptional regulator [Defluviitalea phaphyphila]|uniref:MarR family winged helix-turn-helix transcriptional regulator n=1 Tax=Defluviitalea phaphyphila TaxID=1473580 RepID=UPI0007307E35|nr:MarR family transcriptional regulator [Defluviitalea phaphyphila]